MKEKIKGTRHTCDGCGVERFQVEDADEPPHGFHGEAVVCINEVGGWSIQNWYACQAACIQDAVENALDRATR